MGKVYPLERNSQLKYAVGDILTITGDLKDSAVCRNKSIDLQTLDINLPIHQNQKRGYPAKGKKLP